MVKRYATKQDFTHEYMMSGDPDGRYVDFADYDALAARLAEAERFIAEVRDESAEDFRTSKYVVVQMTTETWEKLKATADSATVCPQCNGRKKFEVAGREIWCPICNGTGSTVTADTEAK